MRPVIERSRTAHRVSLFAASGRRPRPAPSTPRLPTMTDPRRWTCMIVSLCDDGGSDKAAEAALVWTKACGMGITLGIAVPSHMSEVPLFGGTYALSRRACNHDKAPAPNRASGTRAKSTPPLPRSLMRKAVRTSRRRRAGGPPGAVALGRALPTGRSEEPLNGQAWRGQVRALPAVAPTGHGRPANATRRVWGAGGPNAARRLEHCKGVHANGSRSAFDACVTPPRRRRHRARSAGGRVNAPDASTPGGDAGALRP